MIIDCSINEFIPFFFLESTFEPEYPKTSIFLLLKFLTEVPFGSIMVYNGVNWFAQSSYAYWFSAKPVSDSLVLPSFRAADPKAAKCNIC